MKDEKVVRGKKKTLIDGGGINLGWLYENRVFLPPATPSANTKVVQIRSD